MFLPPMAVSTISFTSPTRQSVTRRGFAVHIEIEEIAADGALGERTARVWKIGELFFDLNGEIFECLADRGRKLLCRATLRKPVVSISVRVWIGIQKMFAMPGVLMFIVQLREQFVPGHARAPLIGRLERHDVSNIESGAGSVGVSAWPALPNTVSTSGIFLSWRS